YTISALLIRSYYFQRHVPLLILHSFPTRRSSDLNAQYLGGVGDGAWYELNREENDKIKITRYTSHGKFEYTAIGKPEETIDRMATLKITYDSHLLYSHIKTQDNRKIKVKHLKIKTTVDQDQAKKAQHTPYLNLQQASSN